MANVNPSELCRLCKIRTQTSSQCDDRSECERVGNAKNDSIQLASFIDLTSNISSTV